MEHTLFGTPVDRPTAEMPVIIPAPRIQAPRLPAPQTQTPPARVVAPTPIKPHPLTGKHALVVGINYAPEPTGTAPYTTALAEHLAEDAAAVTVFSGMPHYPSWSLDPAHKGVLRSTEHIPLGATKRLTLRRFRHYIPSRQTAITRAGYEASFLTNALTARLRHRPDLVIAVTPSLSGAVAGARLARRHGSKFLVVVQELTAKAAIQTGIRGGGYAACAAGTIERYALGRADHVAIVSEAFRSQLNQYGVADEKISLLPNWTHISPKHLNQAEARRALGWPVEPFTVVHTGNIGLKQDLGNLVEVARLSQELPYLRFVIVGNGSQRSAVEAQAAGLDNLTFVDPLNGEQYPKALAAADLLVINERPGVEDMSLPSKLTSYLPSGRPVIAAVTNGGATAQELQRTRGAALIVPPGDPLAFLEGVLTLRLDPSRRARMSATGRAYADTVLGRRSAAARLDVLIDVCLSAS
jgi:colanic acid biosynthesis glycosyl transferase WcaI